MLTAISGGCATKSATIPTAPVILQGNFDTVWQLVQGELKNRGFLLDRVDRRTGVIETFGLTSRQWYEFWRTDVVDCWSLTEASLHTIERAVILKMQPAGEEEVTVTCRVTVQRLAPGKNEVVGSALDVLYRRGGLIPAPAGAKARDQSQFQWIPLGNDAALEADILRSLATASRRAGKTSI